MATYVILHHFWTFSVHWICGSQYSAWRHCTLWHYQTLPVKRIELKQQIRYKIHCLMFLVIFVLPNGKTYIMWYIYISTAYLREARSPWYSVTDMSSHVIDTPNVSTHSRCVYCSVSMAERGVCVTVRRGFPTYLYRLQHEPVTFPVTFSFKM